MQAARGRGCERAEYALRGSGGAGVARSSWARARERDAGPGGRRGAGPCRAELGRGRIALEGSGHAFGPSREEGGSGPGWFGAGLGLGFSFYFPFFSILFLKQTNMFEFKYKFEFKPHSLN